MLLVVLLTASLLTAYCDSKCFTDIDRLRCWCRDENDRTIMRITHQKNTNGKWSLNSILLLKNVTPQTSKICYLPNWTNHFDNITIVSNNSSVILSPSEQPPDSKEPLGPDGYQLIGSSLYKLHTFGTYWDKARRICINEDAHLAIINSEIEADYLSVLWENTDHLIEHIEKKESVFIGFHDMFEEGEYITVFGQSLRETGFNVWAPNKPDNRGEVPEGLPGNDCGGLFKTGKLIDLGCDWYHAFICEIEYSDFPAPSKIDYSKGIFPGIELTRSPEQETQVRVKPGFGYKLYPGFSFYRYHTTSVVWDNARMWCEREGAYLAIINSVEELDLLNAIIQKVPIEFLFGNYKNRYVFVGFHCLYKERHFVTLFNESVEETDYTILNNLWSNPQYVGENCGSIDEDGLMNDVDCHMLNTFICEKDVLD